MSRYEENNNKNNLEYDIDQESLIPSSVILRVGESESQSGLDASKRWNTPDWRLEH